MASERTPQQIIGDDAYAQLVFEGYVVTRPAPAATVTGLERYGEDWDEYTGKLMMVKLSEGEFVRFDQAVELLAAQAARIKELEEYAREATKAITGLTGGGSENFGKPIGELYPADLSFCLERIRDRYVSKAELKRLEAKLAATEKALEPFALISSEGVIKQQTGHVTVITCAEYFHKARAVLGGKP